jgi:hypothetical protein
MFRIMITGIGVRVQLHGEPHANDVRFSVNFGPLTFTGLDLSVHHPELLATHRVWPRRRRVPYRSFLSIPLDRIIA